MPKRLFYCSSNPQAYSVRALLVALERLALIAPVVGARRHAPVVLASLKEVAQTKFLRHAASAAGRHADAVSMLAGALALSAKMAKLMVFLRVGLSLHLVYARTMVGIVARGFMAAQRAVTPQQAAHAAGCMRIGFGAPVGIAAAAVRRIAVVLLIALTDLVLRGSIAILADHLVMIMLAAVAGVMIRHAAIRQLMGLSIAGVVAGDAAGSRLMGLGVADAMSALPAGSDHMLVTIAGIVALHTAGGALVKLTITAVVPNGAAGSILMLLPVAVVMAGNAAGSGAMALSVLRAMTRNAAGRSLVVQFIARIMTGSAAGRGGVIPSVAVVMCPGTAGSPGMVEAVTIVVAGNPAGLGAVVIKPIANGMLRILALRHLSQRQHRQNEAQQQCKGKRDRLFQGLSLLQECPASPAGSL